MYIEMDQIKVLLSKNTFKNHCYIIKGNSISDVIFFSQASMDNKKDIGIKRDTYEPQVRSTI